ncbi:hypothetical protein Q5P01_006369 [Channa striata]|uniref:Uncharacterized protein n=1 Tax=Channa striata TaxID=64152 RepID=A0AA88NCV6_CHASR|nr:hypothetical protein Q5P01_006369 [Channa striata]
MSNTHTCPAEGTPVRRKRTLSKSAAKARDIRRITDFFAKRRRTTTDSKILLSPFQTSSSEAALCRTIR